MPHITTFYGSQTEADVIMLTTPKIVKKFSPLFV